MKANNNSREIPGLNWNQGENGALCVSATGGSECVRPFGFQEELRRRAVTPLKCSPEYLKAVEEAAREAAKARPVDDKSRLDEWELPWGAFLRVVGVLILMGVVVWAGVGVLGAAGNF